MTTEARRTDQDAPDVLPPLAPEFRTVDYAPCPTCGRTDFRAVTHRRNHVAKCDLEQLPMRYRDAARQLNIQRAARGHRPAPEPARTAAPYVHLTVACQGDADLYRENAIAAGERRMRHGIQRWDEEV